jgi:hypothetical protein
MKKNVKSGRRSSSRNVVNNRTKASAAAADPADIATVFGPLLDQMEAAMAGMPLPDSSKVRRLAQGAKFAPLLIPQIIDAVNAYPPFSKKNLFDIAAGQEAMAYNEEVSPIGKRLAKIAMTVIYSVNKKLSDSSKDALRAYQWAKSHAAEPEGADARPFVETMQRAVEKSIGRKKKAKTPANTPPTAPPAGQGILAAGLANAASKAAVKAKANKTKAKTAAEKEEEDVLDLIQEIAESD